MRLFCQSTSKIQIKNGREKSRSFFIWTDDITAGRSIDSPRRPVFKYSTMNDKHKPFTAFLALGSNLGDRIAYLRGARQTFQSHEELRIVRASAIYETEPIGGPEEQQPYLNAVLEVQTSLKAPFLLEFALAVEQQFGRCRKVRWGARSLDIDLLFYADSIFQKPDLMVPHPRLHQRAFVLIPLMDVAPDFIHPLRQKTVREMLTQLPSTSGVRRLPENW